MGKITFSEKINKIGIVMMSGFSKLYYIMTLGFVFDLLFPNSKSWSLRKNVFILCLGFLFLKYTMPLILKFTTGLDLNH